MESKTDYVTKMLIVCLKVLYSRKRLNSMHKMTALFLCTFKIILTVQGPGKPLLSAFNKLVI